MQTKPASKQFQRSYVDILAARLAEPRRFLQVVAGPRQVGKTTIVTQALARLDTASLYASADEPSVKDASWVVAQWERGR